MTKKRKKQNRSQRESETKPVSRFRLIPLAGGLALSLMLALTFASIRARASAPVFDVEIVNAYPHDPRAFTQGLLVADGIFYESTGLTSYSTLRKVEIETGRVIQKRDIDKQYFAEGLALWDDKLIQLTYQSGVALVSARESLEPVSQFRYQGEGWGLTHDGTHLIMSDGTATLRFLNPETFAVARTQEVRDGSRPVARLNELEYVDGRLYANVWQSDRIARIDPASGKVLGWLDLSPLARRARSKQRYAEVLNGIAYDAEKGRLFVTGKFWPEVFEIRVVEK